LYNFTERLAKAANMLRDEECAAMARPG